jgi:low temperature requirement protein LtrA
MTGTVRRSACIGKGRRSNWAACILDVMHQSSHRRPLQGRDIHEAHRVSTPLELLFDLTFVVAIAAAASQLHHAVAAQHLGEGMLGFVIAFFAIWWAWMSFTWFASAYDTDDTSYRLFTMLQMVGVLVVAAGVPKVTQGDFTTVVIGYVVMRISLVAMWLRVAREHPEGRRTALRWAIGIVVLQVLWLARLWLPRSVQMPAYFALMALELMVPMWAARAGHTPWHAHHIAERYGLFTIIVLGECVLGAANAVAGVIESRGWTFDLALVGLGSSALVLSLWWVYFLVPSGEALHHHRERAFGWGYGHVPVFASLAALGAFMEVVADQLKAGVPAAADAAHAVAAQAADAAHATAQAVGHVNQTDGAHGVSSVVAIGLVAAATAIYLVAIAWLNNRVTRLALRHSGIVVTGLAILAAVVAAHALGLPLPWAMLLMPLGPVAVIALVSRERARRPEAFAIR